MKNRPHFKWGRFFVCGLARKGLIFCVFSLILKKDEKSAKKGLTRRCESRKFRFVSPLQKK